MPASSHLANDDHLVELSGGFVGNTEPAVGFGARVSLRPPLVLSIADVAALHAEVVSAAGVQLGESLIPDGTFTFGAARGSLGARALVDVTPLLTVGVEADALTWGLAYLHPSGSPNWFLVEGDAGLSLALHPLTDVVIFTNPSIGRAQSWAGAECCGHFNSLHVPIGVAFDIENTRFVFEAGTEQYPEHDFGPSIELLYAAAGVSVGIW